MIKRAIIVGANGQDGKLLTEYLEQNKYDVKKLSRQNFNILDAQSVNDLMKEFSPHELYFLAAFNFSSEIQHQDQFHLLKRSFDTSVIALGYFYQAALENALDCVFFNASSSLIFKPEENKLLSEESPKEPMSIYSNAKLSSMNLGSFYSKEHGLKIYNGILFNHESKYRGSRYLSKKITRAAKEIKAGLKESLKLKSLNSRVDWGAAEDYVKGMHQLLNSNAEPGDYIFATGQSHTVEDFARIAFSHVGLDYKTYIEEDSTTLYRKSYTRIGNPHKLESLGWKRDMDFEEMVTKMVDSELKNE